MGAGDGQVNVPRVRDRVSAAEWAMRVDLAACYRLVAAYGWDDLVCAGRREPEKGGCKPIG